MAKKKGNPCTVCAGSGSVLLPMGEVIAAFYGEEVLQAVARGETIKTWFRCDDCQGTGVAPGGKVE